MNGISKFIIAQKANITLWYGSRMADQAYKGLHVVGINKDKTKRYSLANTRYYVMPDANNRLICMNRSQFHKLRTKKYMSYEAKIRHLMSESFYFTPQANGQNPIDAMVKEYKRVKYIEYCIETSKRNKRERILRRKFRRAVRKAKMKQRIKEFLYS
ncbi:MAG: hypothetical protein WCR45_07950 [Bacteroidaceae bacterium]